MSHKLEPCSDAQALSLCGDPGVWGQDPRRLLPQSILVDLRA